MDSTENLPSASPQNERHDVEAPSEVTDLHPLAERTLRGLTRAKPDKDGLLRPTNVRPLDIRVSRESVERAVRIMDKILKALETTGRKVTVPQEEQGLTTVNVDGEQLYICLYEGIGRVHHVPTDEERARMKKYPGIHGVPEWDERPCGRLTLAIVKEEFRGVRMRWTDGKLQPLDEKVDVFIEGLDEAVKAKKAWREERERERIKWEEERQKEHEASNRRFEEQQRIERLTRQIDDWSRSRRIRDYVADLRENALRPETWTISKVPLPEWMEWALGYADSIDPVAPIRKARRAITLVEGEPPPTS